MTIGVGFLCADGIVLCADAQMTAADSHKYYECKIYTRRESQATAAFTFAGNPSLMKAFYAKFVQAMGAIAAPATADQLQDAIETVLSMMDTLDADRQGLYMLCGIAAAQRELRLLKTEAKLVSPVAHFDYVGIGDSSLLRYLSFMTMSRPLTSTRQAYVLGTYLVMAAKRNIDGCGGDTNALILQSHGTFEMNGAQQTDTVEQNLLMSEYFARAASSAFFDTATTEEQFDSHLERLSRNLKDFRRTLRII